MKVYYLIQNVVTFNYWSADFGNFGGPSYAYKIDGDSNPFEDPQFKKALSQAEHGIQLVKVYLKN